MTDLTEILLRTALIGVGGAALMDAWGLVARRGLGVQGLDYALLGRWIGHLRRGRFAHQRIGAATPIAGERVVGWVAHYAIGVAFAVPLLVIWGPGWVASPTIGPALVVGLVTILAPWLIMQPAMGAGIAAARTPHPWAARLRNVVTHAVYGVGLYLSAAAVGVIWP